MREMNCDNETVWTEFLSYQHQKEERKKQEVTSEMAYLEVQNECECVVCGSIEKEQKYERLRECNL